MKKHVVRKHNAALNCFVCGVKNPLGLHTEFFELEDGTLAAKVTPKSCHQSYPGRVHGGVCTALLDETIGRAINIPEPRIPGRSRWRSTRAIISPCLTTYR